MDFRSEGSECGRVCFSCAPETHFRIPPPPNALPGMLVATDRREHEGPEPASQGDRIAGDTDGHQQGNLLRAEVIPVRIFDFSGVAGGAIATVAARRGVTLHGGRSPAEHAREHAIHCAARSFRAKRCMCGSSRSIGSAFSSSSAIQRTPSNSPGSGRSCGSSRAASITCQRLTSVCRRVEEPCVSVTVTNRDSGPSHGAATAAIPSSSRHSRCTVCHGSSPDSQWPRPFSVRQLSAHRVVVRGRRSGRVRSTSPQDDSVYCTELIAQPPDLLVCNGWGTRTASESLMSGESRSWNSGCSGRCSSAMVRRFTQ